MRVRVYYINDGQEYWYGSHCAGEAIIQHLEFKRCRTTEDLCVLQGIHLFDLRVRPVPDNEFIADKWIAKTASEWAKEKGVGLLCYRL